MELEEKVDSLKGIGPKTAALFEKLKVSTLKDLVYLYPRTYLSYHAPLTIAEAEHGKRVAIKATIQSYVEIKKVRTLKLVTCTAKDISGSIKLLWYNSLFLKQVFHIGQTFIFVGVVTIKNNQLQMEHPEYYTMQQYNQLLSSLRPVYPLTEGLSNKTVTKTMEMILPVMKQIKDYVPFEIKEKFSLMELSAALEGVHFPKDEKQLREAMSRLIFDEFFLFLLRMRQIREHTIKADNHFMLSKWENVEKFIAQLPFSLTAGQQSAIEEIKKDLTGESVMNRLVQGDVGSGKTIVAEVAMLAVVENGYQAAFMAPTEVLAMQHFEGVKKDLEPYGVRCALLCGSTKASEKRKIYERLKEGEIDILIGTHALIQDKVIYHNLALVITDEQHRFGVRQREKLSEKGEEPHVLVMSATPIPRTLALIIYGDLDISVIKDMPACRKKIKNCVVGSAYRPTAYRFMNEQIEAGHQVYIICPMVEENERVEAENVMEYQESLMGIFPPPVHIANLHGKMSAEEKNSIMVEFAEHNIDILISTTVIEVGINNPNATVMMIENAERFGLAQLHQLRGRVGRGDAQSYCIFLCTSDKKEATERLQILNQSNDGFYIANEDLKLRGPGDFFGLRQSGELLFRLGDIYNHADIMQKANDAIRYLEKTKYPFETLNIEVSDKTIQL